MTVAFLQHGRFLEPLRQGLVRMALCMALGATGMAHGSADSDAGPGSESATPDRLDQALACAAQEVRLERLQCYDALFRDTSQSADEANKARSRLWQRVARLETRRGANDMGLMVEQTADSVLMSVPALGTLPPRPVLVISCAANITRFQLHLPQPSDASQVTLTLKGNNVRTTQDWRVLDGGHVLSGGRGLPAIDTLKRLLSGERLALASDMPALDGLSFDMTGLRERIEPLRAMCRW